MKSTVVLTAGQGSKPVNYINALSSDRVDVLVVKPPRTLSWRQAWLRAAELAHTCDGLLLSGGGDPHPALYGREIDGTPLESIDLSLDILELAVINAFSAARKPVLGICRGIQILNVAFGGTLLQDIPGHGRIEGEDSAHTVVLSASSSAGPLGSMIRKHLGGAGTALTVNSAHHQAIENPGEGLSVWAMSDDGIAEGIEHTGLPVAGVQWHPERHQNTLRAVFDSFVSFL